MLQRIQSIYLLFAGLVLLALYLFPLAHNVYIAGAPSGVMVTGIYQDVNGAQAHTQYFTALTAVTAVVALMPLGIIFFYKNRRQQIALCYSAMLVLIGYSFWMAQTVKRVVGDITFDTKNFGIGILLTPLSILLIVLALKGIQRDEKLVKSADRLR